jgi:DASS family divalent anion:Na+ symporter
MAEAAVVALQSQTRTRSYDIKKIGGAVLGAVLGIYVGLHAPPTGLTVPAMHAAGVVVWAILFWIFEVIPEYITSILMCTLWVTLKAVPFPKAFASFNDSNWWILVGAFGLGAAAAKTGLLRRIALLILNFFPATFSGQSWALLGAGTILSPLIPSGSAKAAIASPLALAISDSLRCARKSRGACGIFGAMWIGFCVIGTPAFLSGTFINYATSARFPEHYHVTWLAWLEYAAPWTIVMFIGLGSAIYFLYRPKEKLSLPEEALPEELSRLGPMSRAEKITATVAVLTLVMWVLEPLHKIPSGEIAIYSICVLLALSVVGREDFRKGIDWPAIVYIGCLMNIGVVFQALKIDLWLGQALEPVVGRFITNPYLFVVVFALAVYAFRFVMVSITSSVIIITVVLGPLVLSHGMHPWIVAFIAMACVNIWFFFFMNAWFVLAFYGAGGEMIEHRKLVKLSTAYAIINVVAFLVSVPYWRFLHLIP